MAAARHAGQADDAVGRRARHRVGDDGRRAGAFDDDVGREVAEPAAARDRSPPRSRTSSRLAARRRPGRAHARRGRAARPSAPPAGRPGRRRSPARFAATSSGAMADALDVVPRLGEDARRLQQHAEQRRAPDRPSPRSPARTGSARRRSRRSCLDAALGVSAVAAHVPFAGGAGDAGHRIGPPHDADHMVAGGEAAAVRAPPARGRAIRGRGSAARCPAAPSHRRPEMISRSVPQTPSARAWTSRVLESVGGSGRSSSCTESGVPGMTVMLSRSVQTPLLLVRFQHDRETCMR